MFITASVGVAGAALAFCKLATNDSATRVTLRPKEYRDDSNFPTYALPDEDEQVDTSRHASKKEIAMNVFGGLSYGASATVFFWMLNRELNNKTSPIEPYQVAITVAAVALYAVLGGLATKYPRANNTAVAAAKTVRDGSHAYSALSGILFQSLMEVYKCPDNACWDQSHNLYYSISLIVIASAVGLFAGATTLFPFADEHQSKVELFESIESAKNKLTSCFSSLFSKCSSSNDDNIDSDEENPDSRDSVNLTIEVT